MAKQAPGVLITVCDHAKFKTSGYGLILPNYQVKWYKEPQRLYSVYYYSPKIINMTVCEQNKI